MAQTGRLRRDNTGQTDPPMKFLTIIVGILCAQVLGAASALAAEPRAVDPLDLSVGVDLSAGMNGPIGAHVVYLQEGAAPLSLEEARQAYNAGRFQPVGRAMMSFGIDPNPVWLAVNVENPTAQALERRLLVEVSWIDRIDLYFLRAGEIVQQQRLGDSLPFAERPVEARYFDVPHAFDAGATTVLLRVQSVDPMDLPIYVVTPKQAAERVTVEAYTYGFVYGAILALLGYNFILFLRLKRARYALYALYLSLFIAMNVGYTGHGYWWLWPESPGLQKWLILLFMLGYGLSGLAFAISFLQTKLHFPRLYRAVVLGGVTFGVLEVGCVAADSHVGAVVVAFVFALFFPAAMVLLGSAAVLRGVVSAKYFLTAALAAATGAALTAVSVWGIIPYTVWGYRAVEIGMVIDAVLLALALADQFRVSQEQKNHAEELARIDPLTELNNRRGFFEAAVPVWSTGLRHNRNMSIVVLDLDRFKAFNDDYGHAMGDKALVTVARELRRIGRVGDVAARWGGEEFVLFLPETNLDEAVSVAERLREDIKAKRLDYKGEGLSVTASFGVAQRMDDDASLDEVIEAADHRLYTAKQQGRDRVCAS